MKKFIFVLSIFLIFFSIKIYSQSINELDLKNGFRDMVFGSEIQKEQFIIVEDDNDTKLYSKINDNLQISDYELELINYGFYKDKLFCVYIKTKGYKNTRGVLGILQNAFGNGHQPNEYIEKYYWFGDKVALSFEQNSITDNGTIIYFGKQILDMKKKDEIDKQKKAKENL